MNCVASMEAVLEQEEYGELGCPLCGRPAGAHPSEVRPSGVEAGEEER